MKVQFEPGSQILYSSVNYALLQMILEKLYNSNFNEIVSDRFNSRMRMKHTAVKYIQSTAPDQCRYYGPSGELVEGWLMPYLAGAGGLQSTPREVSSLLTKIMLENGQSILLKPIITARGKSASAGFFVRVRDGFPVFWQSAATHGSRSFCAIVPEKALTLLLMSNSAMAIEHIGLSIIKHLAK
jgi:CubicO group peptidase (beta-lactamase class C family)